MRDAYDDDITAYSAAELNAMRSSRGWRPFSDAEIDAELKAREEYYRALFPQSKEERKA